MLLMIPEILVANGAGAAMVLFLIRFRAKTMENKRRGEWLFDTILAVTLYALVTETLSFLFDGKMFPGCRLLLFFLNTSCVGSTVVVGFVWAVFVDFRLYRSWPRILRRLPYLSIPLILSVLLLVGNLFGNGILFSITPENAYQRGPMNIWIYLFLFFYYLETIIKGVVAKKRSVTTEFFPVMYFVGPCVVGTVVQGMFYGISTGWLTVSVAMVFVYLQLQNLNGYLDDMSGLFNRKYLYHCLDKARKEKTTRMYVIMMDANGFKDINDTYGHSVGDRAISAIAKILTNALTAHAVAIRMAGDEFVILIKDGTIGEAMAVQEAVSKGVEQFNETTTEPFRLSLAMGVGEYDGMDTEAFLIQADRAMYADKNAYHQKHQA